MKPKGPCFDASWRARCVAVPCSVRDVDDMLRAHYLRKRPAVVVLAMMMFCDAFAVGCITYSLPPRETSKRLGGRVVWEMSRLWIAPDVPTNAESWLIAKSVAHIKASRPDVAMLVTYADPSAGHTGTIYRAANWLLDGRTDEGRKSPRFDLCDAVSGRVYGRAKHVPLGASVVRRPRVSKFRFTYALTA